MDTGRIRHRARRASLLIHFLKALVTTEIDISEHATLESIVVKHNTVVLVISVKGHDAHDQIGPIRHLPTAKHIIGDGSDQRRLGITRDIRRIIIAIEKIAGIHPKCLFTLGARKLITRRLIEIGEGNHSIHHRNDRARMDFHVTGVTFLCEMFSEVNNECLILLIGIHVFNETGMWLKGFYVLCKRDLSRGITEWICESSGANAVLIGFFICPHDGITPVTDSVKAIWDTVFNVDQRAGWATFIHEEEHGAISDIEPHTAHGWQATCPFHQLEHLDEFIGLERVANNTVIHEHGNAGELEIRAHFATGDNPATLYEARYNGVRIRGVTDEGHERQILGDTDGGSARCLIRAKEAILTAVELTRAGELHTCVKVETNTTAMTHEIQIGNATHGL